jgi:hypothetical protein
MNIEEIKAREQKATPAPWKATFGMDCKAFVCTPDESEDFKIYNHANADFIAHCRTDIPELLAEVERLNGKLETLKHLEASEHQQIAALKKEYNEQDDAHHKLFMAFCKQKKQIATLKKALKLACTDLADRDYPPSNAEQGAQENVTFYIQLAQEPSCHTCQKVSGCQHRCFEPNDYEPCAEYQAQEQEEKG